MGGEKAIFHVNSAAGVGSPPRGRGKVVVVHIIGAVHGITPAWAGKRPLLWTLGRRSRDHPRVGGEKFQKPIGMLQDTGSPPRGRGKVFLFTYINVCEGITPAWAGKRLLPSWRDTREWDHPRVGGEKHITEYIRSIEMGSPPRGRGKVTQDAVSGKHLRITPAWAGKSRIRRRSRHRDGDHPRVGGEKLGFTDVDAIEEGSPPRGRGKVHKIGEVRQHDRITPAWAGKSFDQHIVVLLVEDHPRVGGEKTKKIP